MSSAFNVIGVGCGRSGTTYLNLVLNSIGIRTNHEKHGKDGLISSIHVSKGKMAAFKKYKNPFTIHIVREPIKVMYSMGIVDLMPFRKGLSFYYADFKSKRPKYSTTRNTQLISTAQYWVDWNKAIEERFSVDLTLKAEDIFAGPGADTLCKAMSKDPDFYRDKIKKIDNKTNSRTGHMKRVIKENYPDMEAAFEYDELEKINSCLCQQVKSLARIYGYYLKDGGKP